MSFYEAPPADRQSVDLWDMQTVETGVQGGLGKKYSSDLVEITESYNDSYDDNDNNGGYLVGGGRTIDSSHGPSDNTFASTFNASQTLRTFNESPMSHDSSPGQGSKLGEVNCGGLSGKEWCDTGALFDKVCATRTPGARGEWEEEGPVKPKPPSPPPPPTLEPPPQDRVKNKTVLENRSDR